MGIREFEFQHRLGGIHARHLDCGRSTVRGRMLGHDVHNSTLSRLKDFLVFIMDAMASIYVFALWAWPRFSANSSALCVGSKTGLPKTSGTTRAVISGAIGLRVFGWEGASALLFFIYFLSVTFQLHHHIGTKEQPPIDLTSHFPNNFYWKIAPN